MKQTVLLLTALFVLSGCAFGTRKPTLTYETILPSAPKNDISIKVNPLEDQRPNKDSVGFIRNGYGMVCAKAVPENDVAEWATESLKTELTNAGYSVVDEDGADNIVDGAVLNAFCDTSFTYNGHVSVKLTLKQEDKVMLDKTYTATSTAGVNWVSSSKAFGKTLKRGLQQVFKEAVGDINSKLLKK